MESTDEISESRYTFQKPNLPLVWLSLAFMAGILLAGRLTLPEFAWLIAATAGLAAVLVLRLLPPQCPGYLLDRLHLPTAFPLLFFVLLVSALFTGAARYQGTLPRMDAHHIAWYNDREYELLVIGTLVDPPDERDAVTNLRVNATSIDTGDETLPVSGLILARVTPGTEWHYGDVLRLRGHLQTPPEFEDFSYQDYLAHQGILSLMTDAVATRLPFTGGNPLLRGIYALREGGIKQIYRLFPDPEASLLAGILFGDDRGLPADLQQAYRNTGTAHIIAISGFNITILASFLLNFFRRLLGPRRGSMAAILGILLYTIMVGASPSVLRAAIMGVLAIFARQLGRRQNGLNTLVATAGVMAAANPHVLWDAGFQLSFGASLGLILYAQPFEDWFTTLLSRWLPDETARKISDPASKYMLFTLAAQLTTLPLMAFHFKRIPLIALIANPFILPAQPGVMVLAGTAVLLSFIYLPLGQVAAWIAWPFAAYTNRAVELFSRFPHGVLILGDFSFLFVILFYAVLFFLTFGGQRVKSLLRPLLTPVAITTCLGISVYLIWSAVFHAPDGHLHLTFLDVGSADAILIQTPSGRSVLVNGGPSPSALSSALGSRLPTFDRSIDWLIVASPQEQQVAALPRLLERYTVSNVLWAGNTDASRSAGDLGRLLAASRTPVTPAFQGAVLNLGDGSRLEVLSITPRGAVLLVDWQGFRALLPVGLDFTSLKELEQGRKVGPVTALLLADSGYAQNNPPTWINELRPQVVLLDVAAGDPDGLPDPAVLEELNGITLLRTDRNGWIMLSTDGERLWVEVEKQ